MSDKDDNKRELVYLGPKFHNQQIVFRPKDDALDVGVIREVCEGQDIAGCDLVQLESREDGPGCYMKYVYKASKGPVKVATTAYREGWDRIFKSN